MASMSSAAAAGDEAAIQLPLAALDAFLSELRRRQAQLQGEVAHMREAHRCEAGGYLCTWCGKQKRDVMIKHVYVAGVRGRHPGGGCPDALISSSPMTCSARQRQLPAILVTSLELPCSVRRCCVTCAVCVYQLCLVWEAG